MDLPARIGKYELEKFLGGGMARVYRARDTMIGRTVAVKILTEAGGTDPDVKARFLAEARTAGNISHENILGIYDFGEDEQHRPFMVMEFLQGEDLRHAIKNGHAGGLQRKLEIALAIARALDYIHSQKIVHRDLKPENVHIGSNGQVKLMDFGISKKEGLELTRTGLMVGTPYYMAPEQVTGGAITPQADIYAFGILLYELLAGKHPIHGDTMERIFYAILNEPLDMEPLRAADVPEPVCQLVARCTVKAPAERMPGFGPVCTELEGALKNLEQVRVDREAPTVVLPGRQPAAVSGDGATAVMPRQSAASWQNEPTVVMPERQPAEGNAPTAVMPKQAAPADAPATAPKQSAAVEPAPARRGLLWAAIGITALLAAGAFVVLRPKAAPPSVPAATSQATLAPAISTPTGEMVLVPKGPFQFGEKKESVTLPDFYIDRTEVTNSAYLMFANATQRALPEDFPRDRPTYPVVNVTVEDARAFAKWAQKRLPTAQEWEKAARGPDGRQFPWGDDPDSNEANVGTKAIRPAIDYASGASPFGALQMIGNAWEFVEDASPAGTVHIRGESFHEPLPLQTGAIWDHATVPVTIKQANIGFRCVRDAR